MLMNILKNLWTLFLAAIAPVLASAEIPSEEKPFVIVIPSYNNREWYEENLNSVFRQHYENYRVIYVADAPTDGTETLVRQYVKEMEQEHRFTLLVNRERSGPLASITRAINTCDKGEIIVDLDGNDWFAHEDVLSKLNAIYSDPDVWMTYGQFFYYPGYYKGFAFEIPTEVLEKNTFRSFGGAATHLKTFYAGLFQKIRKEDLLYNGKFIPKAIDLAFIIPIIEMAGIHSKFVSDVLYIYNNSHPQNDHKLSGPEEEEMDRLIRSRDIYEPLQFPPYEEHFSQEIYQQIDNIRNPSVHDYQFLQNYLLHGNRENIERLGDMLPVAKSIKIIGDSPAGFPRNGKIALNCAEEDKENCLIVYATFNRRYPWGLQRMIDIVSKSDFKGHILYRLGGWPGTEQGMLPLAHVPYAFKVSFFKEAQALGYQRVLWLDTAVVPLVSLNQIFDEIADKGYFIMGVDHNVGPYMNPSAAAYFGLTHEQTYQIPSCSAGLFGVDFTQPIGNTLIDLWHRAAKDSDAFFSRRSDQSALSMILYQQHADCLTSMDLMPHSASEIGSDSLFWLDRESVF